jgi:uncharacterized protein YeaO (DUF488 family)
MAIKIKRVYEKPAKTDGTRILIDRLWPRGLTKEKARVDFWLKDIAPSTELRKRFGHNPAKWPEFRNRYLKELENNKKTARLLRNRAKTGTITLVYGARDKEHNDAVVLKDYLDFYLR